MGGPALLSRLLNRTWLALGVRVRQAAILAAAFAGLFAATLNDSFAPVEHALMDARFELLPRTATGKLVIVEIDAKSLTALETWPWPRRYHGELIDRLREANASLIAFDVDFSSPSSPENDQALADAIERAKGRLVLPSFTQHESQGAGNQRTLSSEPLPMLAPHALIGHVNVWPLGSLARTVRAGIYYGDTYRPAMASLVSDRMSLSIDERYIDFSINPQSIPRVSYVDVLRGTADLSLLAGRTVIIGGTAIELGDRLPVPVFGVLPGVVVQALAAESMSQNRLVARVSPWVALFVAFLAVSIVFLPTFQGAFPTVLAALTVAGSLGIFAAALQIHTAVSLDLAPSFLALGIAAVHVTAIDLLDRARKLARERARSEARQHLIQLIVEDSSDGILAVGETGAIAICNEKAASLFGRSRETFQGAPIEHFLPLSAEPFIGRSGGQGTREPFTFEHTIATPGETGPGTILEVVVNQSYLRIQDPAGDTGPAGEPIFVLTLRDITARRRVEEAERVAAADRLLAERAKSLFIANMSHELRTPLNAIIGFSEILEAETLGPLGHAKYKEYVEIVLKSGQHLLDMVNNVLEISRLAGGAPEVETRRFNPELVIESGIEFTRNARDYRGQAIRVHGVDGIGDISTDARLLKQILVNLLSNAVKFSKPQGQASIDVRLERRAGGLVVLTVEDNGLGMTPEVMANVSQLFYQGDGTFTRKHEGRGLGLYLVKKHAQLLGGRLTITSELGRGTVAEVEFPDVSAAQLPSADAAAA